MHGALRGPIPRIWVKTRKLLVALFQNCDSRTKRLDPSHGGLLAEGPACAPCRVRLARRIIGSTIKSARQWPVLGLPYVEGNMSEKTYDVPAEWAKRAWVDQAKYKDMYARSISDTHAFWAEQAKGIDWMHAPTKSENVSFVPGNISIKWFEAGILNVAHNCIDRHLHSRANQTAIIWEGDDPSQSRHITYKELHDEVCRMANILRTRNVKKGDRVTIYLPMIPEAAYAMLACARIGAIHSVVFAGFSPDSLAQRINDCQSKVIITADERLRGGRKVP